MGLQSDLILLGGALLILIGGALAFGLVDTPGTTNTDVPGDGSDKPKYKLTTEVDVTGDLVDAKLSDFRYSTSQCGALGCGLSFTGDPGSLYLGAKNVYVSIVLRDSSGERIAGARKSIGSIGRGETKTARHSFSNVPEGLYEVTVYVEGQSGDVFDPGNDFIRQTEYNVQIPETAGSVENGGGN